MPVGAAGLARCPPHPATAHVADTVRNIVNAGTRNCLVRDATDLHSLWFELFVDLTGLPTL
jgi:hypothetical protein